MRHSIFFEYKFNLAWTVSNEHYAIFELTFTLLLVPSTFFVYITLVRSSLGMISNECRILFVMFMKILHLYHDKIFPQLKEKNDCQFFVVSKLHIYEACDILIET